MARWERLQQAAIGLLTLTLVATAFAQFLPWRATVQEFNGRGDFRELYLPWGVEYRVNLPGRTFQQDYQTYWDDSLYRTTTVSSRGSEQTLTTREVKPEVRAMLQAVMPLEVAGMLLALAAAFTWVLAPESPWRARLAGIAGALLLLGLVFLLVGTHYLLEARVSQPAASFWIAVPALGAVAALLAAAIPFLEPSRSA